MAYWRVTARGTDQDMAPIPGEMATNVKPCSAKESAYCTVSMFSAALETLYAGTGKTEYCWDSSMEPRAVELVLSVCRCR